MDNQSGIPLVDIAPFLTGGASEKQAVAKAVDKACREIGFLIVAGHGVRREVLDNVQKTYREFFSLSQQEKAKYQVSADRYRGYVPKAAETFAYSLDKQTPPDLRESFVVGPIDIPEDEYHLGAAGRRFFLPNVWPDRPPGLRASSKHFYRAMERVSETLMQIFASALGLPEDFFSDKIDRHITILGAMYYPPMESAPAPGQIRSGAHTDYGSLTIVHTDTDVGGIEVLTPEQRWVRVPYIPDTLIVNLGDLMAEWTNDRWVSTLHRVGLPDGSEQRRDRLSVIFFHQPNYDAEIRCLPTCTGPGDPPRYGATTSGAHREAKIAKHRTPRTSTDA